MYKLIVVDDEIDFRGRIEHILDVIDVGFELSGMYTNGVDALDGILKYEPDLLITDIKMPFMDGMELISKVREEMPLLKVIIISGFDEFDYAKKAIDLGVISYITKPITSKSLEEILIKAKNSLDNEKQMFNDYHTLIKFKETNYKYVYESTLSKYIGKDKISSNLEKRINALDINLEYSHLCLCNFDFDNHDNDLDDEIFLREYITKEFEGEKFELFSRNENLYLLLKSNTPFILKVINKKLFMITQKAKKFINKTVSIGVSSLEETDITPRMMLEETRRALGIRQIIGGGNVFFYDSLDKSTNVEILSENDKQEIKHILRFGKIRELEEFLKNFKNRILMSNISQENLLFGYTGIYNAALSTLVSPTSFYSKLSPTDNFYVKIFNSKTIDESFKIIMNYLNEIFKTNHDNINNELDIRLEKIIDFINMHYSEDISLDFLADKFNLSSGYISSIFKKYKDVSLVKYVTSIRMKKAVELLETSKYKIVEVSTMVGYSEPFYFSHCFKKYYGLSPKTYVMELKNKCEKS